MLKRVLEQTPAIMAVANDKKINKNMLDNGKACCLSFEELTVVEDLVQILEPFQKAHVFYVLNLTQQCARF